MKKYYVIYDNPECGGHGLFKIVRSVKAIQTTPRSMVLDVFEKLRDAELFLRNEFFTDAHSITF